MSFGDFLARYNFVIAIIIIICFLLYLFLKKPKSKLDEPITPEPLDDGKDTTTKRIKRGFGVLTEKIRNSNFVANVQEMQEQQEEDKKKKYDPLGINADDIIKPIDF